ncbi:hypothetical protein CF111_15775 [Aeromonas sobria]|nr:hypothetical protein CF111_15775 [Aeromonas sobria]
MKSQMKFVACQHFITPDSLNVRNDADKASYRHQITKGASGPLVFPLVLVSRCVLFIIMIVSFMLHAKKSQ